MSGVRLSVIIPAHDEAEQIGPCLASVFASDFAPGCGEAVVAANGCRDSTAARAREMEGAARAAGWRLVVLDRPEPGKPGALTAGDAAASGPVRVYLDADTRVSRGLLAALDRVLSGPAPRYASGTPRIAPAESAISRAYGRFWSRLPFVAEGVPGFGVFAVNATGRARWGHWPEIIADDTFARLNFASAERVRVPETYDWPLVEGLSNLVRVRRRQDRGVAEVAALYPQLAARDDKRRPGRGELMRLALREPLGFAAYAAVAAAVRLGAPADAGGWTRGR